MNGGPEEAGRAMAEALVASLEQLKRSVGGGPAGDPEAQARAAALAMQAMKVLLPEVSTELRPAGPTADASGPFAIAVPPPSAAFSIDVPPPDAPPAPFAIDVPPPAAPRTPFAFDVGPQPPPP